MVTLRLARFCGKVQGHHFSQSRTKRQGAPAVWRHRRLMGCSYKPFAGASLPFLDDLLRLVVILKTTGTAALEGGSYLH